jgi:hypothetical protein
LFVYEKNLHQDELEKFLSKEDNGYNFNFNFFSPSKTPKSLILRTYCSITGEWGNDNEIPIDSSLANITEDLCLPVYIIKMLHGEILELNPDQLFKG